MIEGVIACLSLIVYFTFYNKKQVTFREDLNTYHIYKAKSV